MCRKVYIIATSLFAAFFPLLVQAQEESSPLVVCCASHIEETMTRLAGSAVRVEPFLRESAEAVSYEQGNQRAMELLTTADLVVQDAHADKCHQFWAERLRVQGVAVDCVATGGADCCREKLLWQTHDVLVRRFPEKRDVFGRRLNDELRRLQNRGRSDLLARFREVDQQWMTSRFADFHVQHLLTN